MEGKTAKSLLAATDDCSLNAMKRFRRALIAYAKDGIVLAMGSIFAGLPSMNALDLLR